MYSLILLMLLTSFSLFAQSYHLEELVFSDKVQSKRDASTQDIIIIKNFSSEKSLEDTLRNIPGVLIKRSSGVSSFNYRGLPSKYSLILLNGKRVVDTSGIDDGFNLSSLDVSIVSRIEILNGTSALSYGAGAYASVINIITQNYTNKVEGTIGKRSKLETSNVKFFDDSFLYGRVFFEEDNSLSAIENGDEKDKVQRKGISLGYEKEFRGALLKLNAYGLNDFREIDGYLSSSFEDLVGIYSKKEVANISADLEVSQLTISSSYFYSDRFTKDYLLGSLSNSHFLSRNIISSIEFRENNLVVGYENDNQKAVTTYAYKRSIHSLYLIRDLELSSNLKASFSSRIEELDDEFDSSYAFGAVLDLASNSLLRFNYSKGFKRASFYQLYDSFGGNEQLTNEKSDIYDLSYEYLNNFKLSFFYNKLSNRIIYDLTSFRYINSTSLESIGAEFKYLNRLKKIDYEFGATVFETSDFKKRREGYFASVSFAHESWIYFSRFNHIGSKKESSHILAAYNLLAIGVKKSFDSFVFSGTIFNTLNESYQETNGYETLGRNLELSLKYAF